MEPICLGPNTRDIWTLFKRFAGESSVLNIKQTRKSLSEINIYPTKSQVRELVECACECAGRTPLDHITFGEFCVLVTELQAQYTGRVPQRAPMSRVRPNDHLQENRRSRRLAESLVQTLVYFRPEGSFKVFLGGSCNPTTWRSDMAIPYLKEHEVSFYNPQVQFWLPELMGLEDRAKQSANLLFFVIDNQTRSTASMVEAAYLAGCGRQLVVVIKEFENPVVIAEELLTESEVEDLDRSHTYLMDLVERQGIPVFTDIQVALQCTVKVIKQNMTVSDLTLADGVQPVKYPHIRVADRFVSLRDAFKSVLTEPSGKLNTKDLQLAYREVACMDLPPLPPDAPETYTFEDFCCVVSEYKHRKKDWWSRFWGALSSWSSRALAWWRGGEEPEPISPPALIPAKYDIFLGGTCGDSTWRENVAIKILQRYGITYFNPQHPHWSTRYIPQEAAVKENCRLLLYIITGDTRGLSSLLEVAYHIGQGCNIVVCLQDLPENCVVDNEKMTPYAIKDYNRARAYLRDLANRDHIQVFDDVEGAVLAAVHKLVPTCALPSH